MQYFTAYPRHHILYLVVFIKTMYLLLGKKYALQQWSANYGHGPIDRLPVFENKVLFIYQLSISAFMLHGGVEYL